MEEIKVSVLVPAYNVEKYIGKCIESILNQSLKEIEVIIINDGSKDKTLEIIKEYEKKDKRIIVIDKENGGVGTARNEGLKISRGEYILFLDSDDWIEKDYLEKTYNYGKENSLDMVVTDFYKEMKDKKSYKEDLKLEESQFLSGKDYIKEIFLGNGYPNVWDTLTKRELYLKNKINFLNNIFLGDDILVTIKLGFFANKVGKINKAFVHYMQHGNQGTSRNNLGEKILDLFLVFEELNKFFIKNKYKSKDFEVYELNEVYVKFLSCKPVNSLKYEKALSRFINGLQNIKIKKISRKNIIRLNILKFIKNKKIVKKLLELKNSREKK